MYCDVHQYTMCIMVYPRTRLRIKILEKGVMWTGERCHVNWDFNWDFHNYCCNNYKVQLSIYRYVKVYTIIYYYCPCIFYLYTHTCLEMQDFVEHIVMYLCWRLSSLRWTQNRSMRREILILALRMRSFFKAQTLIAGKRQSASFWMAWRERNTVALRTCTDSLQNFLCLWQSKLEVCHTLQPWNGM